MRFPIAAFALLLLPACSESVLSPVTATSASSQSHDSEYGVTATADTSLTPEAASVRVVPGNNLPCSTEVLGVVDVHEDLGSAEHALNLLRARAAKLGAEAVIGVGPRDEKNLGKTYLSGMAVRCKDLVEGRPYDVVDRIDVPGESDSDETALSRIRARGRELQASLIIDVHLEHGEGGSPRLHGTAIRFR